MGENTRKIAVEIEAIAAEHRKLTPVVDKLGAAAEDAKEEAQALTREVRKVRQSGSTTRIKIQD